MPASDDRPALTLADLEANDPRAPMGGKHRRFACPLPGLCEGKPRDQSHRSLSVELATGAWRCYRCGQWGRLKEHWESRPLPPRERARSAARRAFALPPLAPVPLPAPAAGPSDWRTHLAGARPVAGTPGAAYLARRGVAEALATAARVGWTADYYGRPAVLFTLRDEQGQAVALNGRHTDDGAPKAHSSGDRRLGVFSTPGGLTAARLVITEAPIDALSLHAAGCPAIALCGTSWPAWLPRFAAFKRVAVALDADDAGDRHAAELAAALQTLGARVERWRPAGTKDWNAALLLHGAAALSAALNAVPLPPVGEPEVLCAARGCAGDIVGVDPDSGAPYCAGHAPAAAVTCRADGPEAPAQTCPDCGGQVWRRSVWGGWRCAMCLPAPGR